jgi:hypothetical protein
VVVTPIGIDSGTEQSSVSANGVTRLVEPSRVLQGTILHARLHVRSKVRQPGRPCRNGRRAATEVHLPDVPYLARVVWLDGVAGICRFIIQGNTWSQLLVTSGASHETFLEGETGALCHEGGQWRSLSDPKARPGPRSEV